MRKEFKEGHQYTIITLDKPYAPLVYEALKEGQMAKGPEYWPEGDITFRAWTWITFDGIEGVDYLKKDRYIMIDRDEPYIKEIESIIKEYGDLPLNVSIPEVLSKLNPGTAVLVKRGNGTWQEAIVTERDPGLGLRVAFPLLDTFRGGSYDGAPDTVGTKYIKEEDLAKWVREIG